jgi:hypothetical protein
MAGRPLFDTGKRGDSRCGVVSRDFALFGGVGLLLELGIATAEGVEFIAHAMPAHEKFLR